jgi:hypothetical protein
MSTHILKSSLISNNNNNLITNINETQNNTIRTSSRINSAPLTSQTKSKLITKFSSNSFNSLKTKQQQQSNQNLNEPLERFTISYVIKNGYFNLVRYLLSVGVDPNHVSKDATNPDWYTPLIYCTFIKDEKWAISIAQNLLEHGADLKKTDKNKLTPIHYCCAFGLPNLLNLFLNSIDFDLSKSFDKNGNNCMHYAIRSHNLSCVNLIIKKYQPNEMYKRIDLKNSLKLKPSQIEDEKDFNSIKYFNYKFSGIDSLQVCKNTLIDFIKEYSILKQPPVVVNTTPTQPIIAEEESTIFTTIKIKKETSSKSKKRSKSKQKTTNSPQTVEKSEFKNTFFQTEIETILEETKTSFLPLSSNKSSSRSRSPKSKKKSLNKKKHQQSNDDAESSLVEIESFIEPIKQQEPEKKVKPKLIENEPIMTVEQAKLLTSKSFLISLRDRLANLINFSNLFDKKEHMFQSILANRNDEAIKLSLKRSTSVLVNIDSNSNNINNINSNNNNNDLNWKTKLPDMFSKLESFIAPSYRETVASLNQSSFAKKRSKKSSKKSSASNLDSSFRSNSTKRLVFSSKLERRSSAVNQN